MVFLLKAMRSFTRSYFTMILVSITIFLMFVSFHLYQKDKNRQLSTETISSPVGNILPEVPAILPTEILLNKVKTEVVTEEKSTKSDNMFAHYASDNHLRSLLRQQSNSLGQVVVSIIGGDSYSLFAWDWYDRMLQLSNDTKNCHCFLIAMDEIGVVLATQQGVPVFYSTFTFDQQMLWINSIETRQHSLYRVGHAKFDTSARIVRMGHSVMLTEMDVFWKANPLNYLKPLDVHDLQISHHYGAHPRVNIGVYYVQSTNLSIAFFSHVAEFWLRYGKGGYLADQRVLDALLNNYDRLEKTYLKAMKPLPSPLLNWTTHDFGNHFSHLMTDGSAFMLFNVAAKLGIRSKKFHGTNDTKFLTATITNPNMSVSHRNLIMRALLILQHTHLKNRTFIVPDFSTNLTVVPIQYQLDIKKFLLYWSEQHIRLSGFLLYDKSRSIPVTTAAYSSKKNYDDINGILDLTVESIPLDLPAPSPQFEVQVRDSLLWCSPPMMGGGWCSHHPRDFGATMEILFACRGDPYPPCANKTERNEQFLERPYEQP